MSAAPVSTTPPAPETAALRLEFDQLTIGDWKKLLAQAPHSNLLLSWPVALATFESKRQRPFFGVFYNNNTPVALVVVHRWAFLSFERVNIHRGPVWLMPPCDSLQQQALHLLMETLTQKWGKKPLRRRTHLLPELPNREPFISFLRQQGCTPLNQPPYGSIWLDITPDNATLEQNLSQSCRNKLRKSRKHQLRYIVDYTRPGYKLFLRGYRQDKHLKKYQGPSPLFLLHLRKHARKEDFLLLEAWDEGQLVAGQLFVCHGQCATYLIGWTTPEGRAVAAHNGLLWDAALPQLKERGISALDLGGLSPKNLSLNHFKQGLGGASYELIGGWRL